GLEAASAISAPPALSAPISTAVSAVTCRHAATRSPSSGRSAANRSPSAVSTGIERAAHEMCRSPLSHRSMQASYDKAPERRRPSGASDTRRSVAVVVGLVRALHVDADVGRLLLGELGELDAEGVEVQPGDLLVEVLGQRVDADRVVG